MSQTPQIRELVSDVMRAGFYPELVMDTVATVFEPDEIIGHLVQLETHFDHEEVHRHITVLVLTESHLLAAHLDDQQLDEEGSVVAAHINSEVVPLRKLGTVTTNLTYLQPQTFIPGTRASEIQISIAWTGSQRLDMAPADCPDPQCTADHGFTGTGVREDIMVRVSASADGATAIINAQKFASALRKAQIKATR
ncbi:MULTISPECIES: DUF5998 family protein [unclassified Rothia (in: high G+C Gram-positive bacteria)]|uniref:DUF5998 family protein n=1 Tax=unclassified Rothia (in: high G+C Gram-positive bacteria) TaxID=2689056 RepID=UPI0019595C21|nr:MULTISPECIES: DUF5998 family protein [unclassified Rothia (in: high G+C Gram-positive bacteria)]MBM7050705.1 cell wall biosynthesis glycosyltransferase [Rothia sp. ZJ1223]QRZ60891.1 cell wall biosynthesis glycosyltransferase [Rothia sp. ZJ932]